MGLRWIDFSILVAYLCTLVMIGLRFSRRQNTTEAYYVAKRGYGNLYHRLSDVLDDAFPTDQGDRR